MSTSSSTLAADTNSTSTSTNTNTNTNTSTSSSSTSGSNTNPSNNNGVGEEKEEEKKEEEKFNSGNEGGGSGEVTDMTQLQKQKIIEGVKNRILIGTFDSGAFHFSFKNGSDPLSLSLWPVFGFPRIPCIGTYGDNYLPNIPLVLIELNLTEKIFARLPTSVRDALSSIIEKSKQNNNNDSNNNSNTNVDNNKDNKNNNEIENSDKSSSETNNKEKSKNSSNTILSLKDISAYFEIHGCPKTQVCQHFNCEQRNESNMMYHPWLYDNVDNLGDELDMQDVIWMGIFEPSNVFSVHIEDIKTTVDRGVAFNALEQRSVFLHGWAFSPCNAQFGRDPEAGFCSFYAIGCTKDYSRCTLSYHIIANNEDNEMLLKYAVKECKTIRELQNTLEMLSWGDIHSVFQSLITP